MAASLATWWLAAAPASAWAQAVTPPAAAASAAPGIELRMSPELKAPPRGDAAKQLPAFLEAREVRGRPDLETIAEGDVEFRRGGVVIRADRLTYEQSDDLATARGNVRISKDGNRYSGPELQLKIQRFEGYFLNPTYYFARTGAGGTAKRIDFIDEQHSIATGATYTSCTPDGSGTPAWLLSTNKVDLDFATNEGVAEGAVLRFLGMPILAAPHFSFPLTDARKSGWLPPTIVPVDSRSGPRVGVPYYWNIAPNRDMTFYPEVSTRRSASLGTEFRYLEPSYNGAVKLNLTPYDRTTGTTRYGFTGTHDSDFGGGLRLETRLLRVSDDDYWKDFPSDISTLTPRLLQSDVNLMREAGDWTTYIRMRGWQVLQTTDPT
ncbi:MAG TPA: LPS assembly protein LptD, partial [Burkholderiaceae bacterium]|nr:LPS assembly protein LptD [Burkholderiaceae bacterium]